MPPKKTAVAAPPPPENGLWFRVVGNHSVLGVHTGDDVFLDSVSVARHLTGAGHVRLLDGRGGKPLSLTDQMIVLYELGA